jgi:hypothetical protein
MLSSRSLPSLHPTWRVTINMKTNHKDLQKIMNNLNLFIILIYKKTQCHIILNGVIHTHSNHTLHPHHPYHHRRHLHP